MKVLKIDFYVSESKMSCAYWCGGESFVDSDETVGYNVNIYQNVKAQKYPTPWFVKTVDSCYEAILLRNMTFYDMKVTVNGVLYDLGGMKSIVVPDDVAISPAFVELCHQHAVYDLRTITDVYVSLSRLSWATGVNSFAEVSWK